jgi:hypothetical protein
MVGCSHCACDASIATAVAVAQQAATEAPTGFDTPTLVENPGSQSVSNGIAEPAEESFARRCQPGSPSCVSATPCDRIVALHASISIREPILLGNIATTHWRKPCSFAPSKIGSGASL